MKNDELEKRIAELEQRIRQLEAQPKEHHYHYYPPMVLPPTTVVPQKENPLPQRIFIGDPPPYLPDTTGTITWSGGAFKTSA